MSRYKKTTKPFSYPAILLSIATQVHSLPRIRLSRILPALHRSQAHLRSVCLSDNGISSVRVQYPKHTEQHQGNLPSSNKLLIPVCTIPSGESQAGVKAALRELQSRKTVRRNNSNHRSVPPNIFLPRTSLPFQLPLTRNSSPRFLPAYSLPSQSG